MPITDLSVLDTKVGAEGEFAPPALVTTKEGYSAWLREKYTEDRGFAQAMAIAARRALGKSMFATPPVIKGPYAQTLKTELRLLDEHLRKPRPI